MKISVLLPYKENYSFEAAGAVSLFVHNLNNASIYKKNTTVYGNTDNSDLLDLNYKNISFTKNFWKSSSKTYVDSFLNLKNTLQSDIIEIHNRPYYFNQIKNVFKNKIFLYFHNDPLLLQGSKKVTERLNLLNKCDKLLFNSNWSRNRFFQNIKFSETYKNKTLVCYQSTSKVSIDFSKKEKIISFIGRLNSSKGYDIFGKAIIDILNKNKDWKATVIGDEPREKLTFNHKRLNILGFKNNKFILNYLKKVSISVVCSRWNEPFGRSSLEAASRGSAVVISKRGGLPETIKNPIILDELSVSNLKKKINQLIYDKSLLLKKQKEMYKSFFLTHKYVSKLIDELRKPKLNNFFINKDKKILKILHITNFNNRFDGRLHYNTSKRINNGFVRLGHNVLSLSDRDITNYSKSFNDLKGIKALQKITINNVTNFNPDIVFLGHADSINVETLEFIKLKGIKIAQWFLDPIGINTPDYLKNKKRLLNKSNFIDSSFVTTDPYSLNFKSPNTFYIPNPSDQSFEILNNYNTKTENDVFFAMSHGVHRGTLKRGKFDNREILLKKLIKQNSNLVFDFYGFDNREPIWGNNFIDQISKSSMGLNLSRGKPIKYYSSDRIAQLMGNGLLTFIDSKTSYSDFFSKKEIVTYDDLNDLNYLLQKYKKDEKQRKLIARNGKLKYMKYFNSNNVCSYMIEKTLDIKNSKKYLWLK